MVLISVGAPSRVIPRPTGEKKASGSVQVTNADFKTICEYVVPRNKTFHPSKVSASAVESFYVKLRFGGEDISITYHVPDGIPFMEWFPWGWHPCVGDGTKKVELQAMSAAQPLLIVEGEICGEEE